MPGRLLLNKDKDIVLCDHCVHNMGKVKKLPARKVYPPGSLTMPLHSTGSVYTSEDLNPQNSPLSLNISGESSSGTLAVADSEETSSTPVPGSSTSATSTLNVTNKTSNRPKQYQTKHRRLVKKTQDKQEKKAAYQKAVRDFERGKFKSLRKCATHHKLPVSTLHRLLTTGGEFQGSGPTLSCLSLGEEAAIIQHVKFRAQIGCGVDFGQLQLLIQESLIAVKSANPDRETGYESSGQLPNKDFVRRMVDRHNLSLRRTGEISKGVILFIVSNI